MKTDFSEAFVLGFNFANFLLIWCFSIAMALTRVMRSSQGKQVFQSLSITGKYFISIHQIIIYIIAGTSLLIVYHQYNIVAVFAAIFSTWWVSYFVQRMFIQNALQEKENPARMREILLESSVHNFLPAILFIYLVWPEFLKLLNQPL